MKKKTKIFDLLNKKSDMTNNGDNVTFEIEDCYEVETEIGKIDIEKGPKKPIMIQTKEEFENILNYGEEKI